MPSKFQEMTMSERDYVIPFVGLRLGIHTFDFEIADGFFESIEYSTVQKGNVKVTLSFEKKETMMIGIYQIDGTVNVPCNYCNSNLEITIDANYRLVYKFDDVPSDDESLRIIYPEEFELDVRQDIMELITVSLPNRAVHPEGECDEEMVELLDEYTIYKEIDVDECDVDEWEDEEGESDENEEDDDQDEGGEIDPRWAALKDL